VNAISKIAYAVGDATYVEAPGPCVIAHVTNNLGAWGRGFTVPLETRYPGQAEIYRRWARGHEFDARGVLVPFGLGKILVARTPSPDVFVAHLCAQAGLPGAGNPHPLDYEALDEALGALAARVAGNANLRRGEAYRIQMPRIGAGLARGNWAKIAPLVERTLCAVTSVTVLDPPKPAPPRSP
jgi:O-acetyl-ADP-ribose deacetylase (regulator of RNase III)